MKEVLAVIRMNKMNETKQALVEAGIASFTARKVVGRGKGKVDYLLLKGAEEGHEEAISQLGPGPEDGPQTDADRRRARQDGSPGRQHDHRREPRRATPATERFSSCPSARPFAFARGSATTWRWTRRLTEVHKRRMNNDEPFSIDFGG